MTASYGLRIEPSIRAAARSSRAVAMSAYPITGHRQRGRLGPLSRHQNLQTFRSGSSYIGGGRGPDSKLADVLF
jgi:hypothetical protein